MKVIFLTSALQSFLFCRTFQKYISYIYKYMYIKKKSTPSHLGNYFENYIQYLKTQTVVLHKILFYFQGDAGKCNFKTSKSLCCIFTGIKG